MVGQGGVRQWAGGCYLQVVVNILAVCSWRVRQGTECLSYRTGQGDVWVLAIKNEAGRKAGHVGKAGVADPRSGQIGFGAAGRVGCILPDHVPGDWRDVKSRSSPGEQQWGKSLPEYQQGRDRDEQDQDFARRYWKRLAHR